jgi:IS5 family transposase
MIVDALGNPLTFTLTAANVADVSAAKSLIEKAPQMRTLIGDKGYDSDELIAWLKERGTQALIPSRKNRLRQRPIDTHLYKLEILLNAPLTGLNTSAASPLALKNSISTMPL